MLDSQGLVSWAKDDPLNHTKERNETISFGVITASLRVFRGSFSATDISCQPRHHECFGHWTLR